MWLRLPLALVVLGYAGLTLVLMVTLGFREPFADQWRQTVPLLEGSLPGSVFQLESGHRQVLPNLVRLLDLHLAGGGGGLLAWSGVLLYATALAVLLRVLLRDRGAGALQRWTAHAVVALGCGFLGQARMLMHPNESVQVAGVYLGLTVTLACLAAPATRARLAVALLACTAATFSFGTGFATFVAAGLLLVLRAASFRHLAAAVASGVFVLVAYRFLLPSGEAIGANVHLAPLQLAADLPRWLAAPFVQAFFGLGDPQFQNGIGAAVAAHAPHGGVWVDLATWCSVPLGPVATRNAAAAGLGAAGIVWLAIASRSAVRAARSGTATAAAGLALAWFAVAVGGLVCVARTGYFEDHGDQRFAERFLVWSVLFWVGLALWLLDRWRGPRSGPAAAIGVCATALLLWPVQRAWISWTVATRNQTERTALALRLGVDDPAAAPSPEDLNGLPFARCVQPVQRRRLQMFAEPAMPALGAQLAWSGPPPTDELPSLAPPHRLVLPDGRAFAHESLSLPSVLLGEPGQEWPIVDAAGVVVGRLRADEASALWRRLPDPLVSRRGNLYVRADAGGAPGFVVGATAPHRALAIVPAPR